MAMFERFRKGTCKNCGLEWELTLIDFPECCGYICKKCMREGKKLVRSKKTGNMKKVQYCPRCEQRLYQTGQLEIERREWHTKSDF